MNLLYANDARGRYPDSWYACDRDLQHTLTHLKRTSAPIRIGVDGFTAVRRLHTGTAGRPRRCCS